MTLRIRMAGAQRPLSFFAPRFTRFPRFTRSPPYTRYPLFMALERDPHRNREHHLVRATEDVQVAALEIHREAAEWQIVSEAGIEAEVPLSIRVSDEGVHVVGAVVRSEERRVGKE